MACPETGTTNDPKSRGVTVHAELPPAGLVELTRFPSRSTPRHSETDGQLSPSGTEPFTEDARLQAAAPPVGFVDVTMLPLSSSTTHSVVDGHETATRPRCAPVIPVDVQAPLPPVGDVDVITDSESPTSTHRLVDGHETANKLFVLTLAACHASAPAVGFVDVSTFPALSTATQSDTAGQVTLAMPLPASTLTACQADVPPIGLVDVTTSPPPTPTHNETVGQESAEMVLTPATDVGVHAPNPPVGSRDVTRLAPPAADGAAATTHSDTDGQEAACERNSGMVFGCGSIADDAHARGDDDAIAGPAPTVSPTITKSAAASTPNSARVACGIVNG
jgi:hypothetical protein